VTALDLIFNGLAVGLGCGLVAWFVRKGVNNS
jgi:hypothetical protein